MISSLVFMLRERQSNEASGGVRDELGLPGAPAPKRVSGVSVLTPSRPPHPRGWSPEGRPLQPPRLGVQGSWVDSGAAGEAHQQE